MAGSQYGRPVIVGGGHAPQTLTQISLSGTAASSYNERWLQELVFDHPELLPIDQIDSGYKGLVPICMELNTPSGPVDALYATPEGKLVVVEAKLWRNHEARRKVVAQILDYAQALTGLSYEGLLKEVCRTTKRSGNALWEIVREQTGAVDEQAFSDGVARCLRTSEFLLLIVGDGIREGAGAIANFLEVAGRFNFTFGLVELAIFDIGDGRRLVQPRVLAQTVLIDRPRYLVPETIRVSDSDEGLVVDEASEDASKELTVREAACRDFWREFLAQLRLNDQNQPYAKVQPWSSIYFSGPLKSRSWFTVKIGKSGSDQATVLLTFARGPIGDFVYRELEAQRASIEKEISLPIEWISKDGKHTIATEKRFSGDLLALERRTEVFMFLSASLNELVNAFRDRMAEIVNRME